MFNRNLFFYEVLLLQKILSLNFLRKLFLLILLGSFFYSASAQFKVVGYYPDWLKSTLPPNKIEFENIDYLIHAFAWPESDGSIEMYDGMLNPQLNQAVHNANKKILISFGGYGQSDGFGPMSADSSTRAAFINNVVNFLVNNNYDGIDLDWENPSTQQQKTNFTTLIKELREKFNEMNTPLLITMAVPAGDWNGKWIEYEKVVSYIDWFAIMAYDFYGSWSSVSGPNAPLYQSTYDIDNAGAGYNAVQYMTVMRKVPKNKILLGMPFYGKEFNSSGMYKPYSGAVPEVLYSDVISLTGSGGWNYNWDDVSKIPYYLNNGATKLITFDDTASIRYKVEFSLNQNLAGVMIWALGQDLVNGKQPLLETIGNTIKQMTSVELADDKSINDFRLYNNYPNPFNPSTTIRYSIPTTFVQLKVFDLLGNEVATLVNEEKHAGFYKVTWNAASNSSGVYFYQLKAGGFISTKEMMLIK
jgi:chitinase